MELILRIKNYLKENCICRKKYKIYKKKNFYIFEYEYKKIKRILFKKANTTDVVFVYNLFSKNDEGFIIAAKRIFIFDINYFLYVIFCSLYHTLKISRIRKDYFIIRNNFESMVVNPHIDDLNEEFFICKRVNNEGFYYLPYIDKYIVYIKYFYEKSKVENIINYLTNNKYVFHFSYNEAFFFILIMFDSVTFNKIDSLKRKEKIDTFLNQNEFGTSFSIPFMIEYKLWE